jgi:hypothetical protein
MFHHINGLPIPSKKTKLFNSKDVYFLARNYGNLINSRGDLKRYFKKNQTRNFI